MMTKNVYDKFFRYRVYLTLSAVFNIILTTVWIVTAEQRDNALEKEMYWRDQHITKSSINIVSMMQVDILLLACDSTQFSKYDLYVKHKNLFKENIARKAMETSK